jgi:hypothetical protein
MKGTDEPLVSLPFHPLTHGTQPGEGVGDSPDVASSRMTSLGSVPDLHANSNTQRLTRLRVVHVDGLQQEAAGA